MKISATVITKNEERVIADCLRNILSVVDEIVVVDSGSSDRTVEIAETLADRVDHHVFQSFSEQKNHAADLCSNDWILNIDADERMSPELEAAIQGLKASRDTGYDAFCFPRKTYQVDGSLVFNIVSYPGFHYRLYNRTRCRWIHPVHESLQIEGRRKFLPHHLLHYPNYDRVPEKEELYGKLKAQGRERVGGLSLAKTPETFWFHFRALFIDLGFYRKGWTYWKHGAQILFHLAGLKMKQTR